MLAPVHIERAARDYVASRVAEGKRLNDVPEVKLTSDHDILIEQSTYLKILVRDVRDMREAQIANHKDLDTRVRVLEAAYWKLMGAGACAGAFGGFLVKLLTK